MDIVIRNGEIYDPETGRQGIGNIGIRDGIIQIITKEPITGKEIVDAEGLQVVPGFIDLHIHEDPMTAEGVNYSTARAMLRMGVTTAVGGNCGFSPLSISEYGRYVEEKGAPVNLMLLAGYNVARGTLDSGTSGQSAYRQGNVYRNISRLEMEKVKTVVEKGLRDGAFGLSFGLEYTPGCTTEEMVEAGKLLRNFENTMLTAHYRYDMDRALESVEECIAVGAETGVPFQFSHIGSCAAFGMMKDCLQRLRQARESGVDIHSDCYPYHAFSTLIGSTVFDEGCFERWGRSYDSVLPTQGQYKNQFCTRETFEYLRKEEPDTRVVCFVMDEAEVELAYRDPDVIAASDGKLILDQGHCRSAGTFPRVLGRYCRERGVLTFEEAVRKMTLLPAERMKLKRKGRIQEGCDGDITILNKDTVIDKATFTDPALPPEGICHVILGGRWALRDGVENGEPAGKMLYRHSV